MPDSSNSHQTAVSSEIMSNKESKAESDKKGPDRVHIDLGEVTQHNIKVLKKVNQVISVKVLNLLAIFKIKQNVITTLIIKIEYCLRIGCFSGRLSRQFLQRRTRSWRISQARILQRHCSRGGLL